MYSVFIISRTLKNRRFTCYLKIAKTVSIILLLSLFSLSCAQHQYTADSTTESPVLFKDSLTGNWQEKWFLDGRKATVKTSEKGLFFSGGTITKLDDPQEYHAHHAVLWTHQIFEGDI